MVISDGLLKKLCTLDETEPKRVNREHYQRHWATNNNWLRNLFSYRLRLECAIRWFIDDLHFLATWTHSIHILLFLFYFILPHSMHSTMNYLVFLPSNFELSFGGHMSTNRCDFPLHSLFFLYLVNWPINFPVHILRNFRNDKFFCLSSYVRVTWMWRMYQNFCIQFY